MREGHTTSPSWMTLIISSIYATMFIIAIMLITPDPFPIFDIHLSHIVPWERAHYHATNDKYFFITSLFIYAIFPLLSIHASARLPLSISQPLRLFHRYLKYVMIILWIIIQSMMVFTMLSQDLTDTQQYWVTFFMSDEQASLRHAIYFLHATSIISAISFFLYTRYPSWTFRTWEIPTYLVFHLVGIGTCLFLVFPAHHQVTYRSMSLWGGEATHQFHHSRSYIGPIHDVLMGKWPLVDIFPQYGYLATLIPAMIFTSIPLSFGSWYLYTAVIMCLYVIGMYGFLWSISKKWWMASLGTLFYIKYALYRHYWYDEALVFPSTTPVRYGWDLLFFFFFWKEISSSHPRWRYVTPIFAIGSVWYDIEFGICILMSYLITQLWSVWKEKGGIRQICLTGAYGLLSVCTVSSVSFFKTGTWPDIHGMFTYMQHFTGGYYDLPLPFFGPHLGVAGIYLLTYLSIMQNHVSSSYRWTKIKIGLLVYGCMIFLYYLGLSDIHHFAVVVHPSILLSCILYLEYRPISFLFSHASPYSKTMVTLCMCLILSFFLWNPMQFFSEIRHKTWLRYRADTSAYRTWTYPGTRMALVGDDEKHFSLSSEKIRTYVPGKEVLILSRYDTLLFVMAQKTSILPYSYLEYAYMYQKDLDDTLSYLSAHAPKYVFVYTPPYDHMEYPALRLIWEHIKDQYVFVEHAGVVDVYTQKQQKEHPAP